MSESGIDISNQHSKIVKEFLGEDLSYVITVCDSAKESCPVFPGKYDAIQWSIEDPASSEGTASEIMADFRRVHQSVLKKTNAFDSEINKQ